MKVAADWIREHTPGWTDEQRYKLVAAVHSWGPPICLGLFVFSDNVVVRFVVLLLEIVTLVSEFALQDCIVTMVEKEFSDTTWDDLFARFLKAGGYTVTRPEKMMFNIGLNTGLLIMMILVLLRQSVLWILGFVGIAVTALPSLALFSTIPPIPEIVPPILGQTL
jgi:hypothetical protein